MRLLFGSLVLVGVGFLVACSSSSDEGGAAGSQDAAGANNQAGTSAAGQSAQGGSGSGQGGHAAGNPAGGAGLAGQGASGQGQAGKGQAGQGTGGQNASDSQQYCVDKINEYRKTLGLPPYARWDSAETCADGEAKSDSETMKAHGAFGTCGEFAQDECPGWPGPEMSLLDGCLAQMWAEGPGDDFSAHGHYINMSSTKYTQVSCGFYQTPTGGFWAVQNFK